MSFNEIVDVSALTLHDGLEDLFLSGNQIVDVSSARAARFRWLLDFEE